MKLIRYILWGLLSISTFCTASAANLSKLLPDERNTIEVFQKVSPHVVYVHRLKTYLDTRMNAYHIPAGTGSGIIWNDEGYVVTNYHVVRGAVKLAVGFGKGQAVAAKVIGVAPRKDIAVLKIDNSKAKAFFKRINGLPLADSSQLLVGQKTIAIGNPFGLDRTLTTGVISALGREVPGVSGVSIADMIQTDASINPGNSGGPLLDSQGRLIGMNTAIFSRSGASAGIGFAVPVNDIKRVVEQILQHGRVVLAGIGVQRIEDSIARQLGVAKGVLIGRVLPQTPAAKAGLRPTYRDARGRIHLGDIIIGIDGKPVKDYDDLYHYLSKIEPGKRIQLEVVTGRSKRILPMNTIDIGRNQP